MSTTEPLIAEEIDVNNGIRIIREYIHPEYSGITGHMIRRFIGWRAVDKLMRIYKILHKFHRENPHQRMVTAHVYK